MIFWDIIKDAIRISSDFLTAQLCLEKMPKKNTEYQYYQP